MVTKQKIKLTDIKHLVIQFIHKICNNKKGPLLFLLKTKHKDALLVYPFLNKEKIFFF
jgi:hypothetical protein